jgi:hypothetical protein
MDLRLGEQPKVGEQAGEEQVSASIAGRHSLAQQRQRTLVFAARSVQQGQIAKPVGSAGLHGAPVRISGLNRASQIV